MNADRTLVTDRDSQPLTIIAPTEGALTPQQVLGQVALIQQVMAGCMKDGEHYGKIPGCGEKPTLLKSGAEKLCLTCRLSPSYHVDERQLDGGHREYRITTTLTSLVTDKKVGEGVGSCSTMEAKYRYRGNDAEVTDKPVPRTYWDVRGENPAKAQELLGGKEFMPKKVDGQGWMIAKKGARSENPDLADQYNTVLKMAKKRALVDAVLTATAASDIFSQDLEDISANIAAQTPAAVEVETVPLAPARAAESPAKAKTLPMPTTVKSISAATASMTKEQAESTRIHFGTNKDRMLSELNPQQRAWYADKWLRKKEQEGKASAEDKVLMGALKALYPLAKDKPLAAAEDENQETTALLTNLGQLIAKQQGFSGDDLRDWLRTLMRGKQPILAADKEIDDLPASELESILKNWKKVAPDVTAFRKKREQQDLIDTAPLN